MSPKRYRVLIALLLLTILCGCGEYKKRPLRLGMNIWPGYECLFLAQELGYFEEEGVDVQIFDFTSLEDNMKAFSRGDLDLMTGTMIEYMLAQEQGAKDAKVVRVFDYSNGGDVILGKNLKGVADLKGKNVGLEVRSLNIFLLKRALEKVGLQLSDVNMLDIAQMSMAEQLTKGNIHASVTYPPASIEMMALDGVSQLFSSRDLPGEVVDVLVAHGSVLTKRRADIQKILRAYNRAMETMFKEPNRCYRIMAKREGISPEEFKAIIEAELVLLNSKDQIKYSVAGGPMELIFDSVKKALVEIGAVSQDKVKLQIDLIQ
jgi:NitT/TauT family transport system substrate-binding protein